MKRPAEIFDREWEWDELVAFAQDARAGATLGIVSGRRRQGKSLLLESLCAAADGFYFAATEATETELLRRLGEELGRVLHAPAALRLTDWGQAVDALLDLGAAGPRVVVLDEFPYLCKASPELPSVLQRAFGPTRSQRRRSQTRLILCGSALSFMGGLLSGQAPLRGRAGLELRIATFDVRTAARFWEIDDHDLALRIHAIVGGTPAYRREFVRDDRPKGRSDFDAWVTRTVLNPACPLFQEARYLLAEESELRDPALYHSVLAAIAEGHTTRGRIASFIGRPSDTLRHPLTVLEDAGFVVREQDVFRRGRSTFRIAEPLVGFYHAVMRPELARLERPGRAAAVWVSASPRFQSRVVGPHFEALARAWARDWAAPSSFGRPVARVGSGVVNDPERKQSYQVDVAVFDAEGRLLSIGEAKAGRPMGQADVQRLQRVARMLERGGLGTDGLRLACYSAAGFERDLMQSADADGLVLVDIARIYEGG